MNIDKLASQKKVAPQYKETSRQRSAITRNKQTLENSLSKTFCHLICRSINMIEYCNLLNMLEPNLHQ